VVLGHRLAGRVFGQGARRALALHCSLAHSGAWSGLAAALSDLLTIDAFDLPGHGRSADWDGTTDLHRLATAAAAAWAEPGPVDLIGHSFGATVALRLAEERPELVRSLVLVEPVLFAAARGTDPVAHDRHVAHHRSFAALLAAGDRAAAAAMFHAEWGAGESLAALPESQRAYILARIAMILAADRVLLDDAEGLLAPGRIEAVSVPVLLVDGALSPPVIDAVMTALARRLTRPRRVTVPGAGHMVAISHAAAVADAVRAHLAAVPANP
jgi:pimeloyl-ACP methyl ester carboxylesterase